MTKKIIIGVIVLVVVGAGVAGVFLLLSQQRNNTSESSSNTQQPTATFDKNKYSVDEPGGLWWVVNKHRTLSGSYAPSDLVVPKMKLRWDPVAESMHVSGQVAPSLEALYKASQEAGFDLVFLSGYRSYETQKELYDGYVASIGQEEADRVSAKPGTSEHQTGLAVDLGRTDQECEFDTCFGDTNEGRWLAANAHKYGFIIRYPKGKEAIVGYAYEPWHLRYVGEELAAELFETKETMEEFFGL